MVVGKINEVEGMFQTTVRLSLLIVEALMIGSNVLAQGNSELPIAAAPPAVQFRTDAFQPGVSIPKKFTADGLDVSPALFWGKLPPHARSLAIVVDDPDAPSGTWVHWLLYDIPATQEQLKESVSSAELNVLGIKQGKNSFGRIIYNGPAPPPGKAHRYYFKLYVLDTKLNLPGGADKNQLLEAINGKVLSQAEFMGMYSR